jgi:hypothetical protein
MLPGAHRHERARAGTGSQLSRCVPVAPPNADSPAAPRFRSRPPPPPGPPPPPPPPPADPLSHPHPPRPNGVKAISQRLNHRPAQMDMNMRSLIKATTGRPGAGPASGRYRREMQRTLRGSQKCRPYGQRAQAETVMGMLKRNLGDALRARTTDPRKMELLPKVVTHNLMIVHRRGRGSQQSPLALPKNGGAWIPAPQAPAFSMYDAN